MKKLLCLMLIFSLLTVGAPGLMQADSTDSIESLKEQLEIALTERDALQIQLGEALAEIESLRAQLNAGSATTEQLVVAKIGDLEIYNTELMPIYEDEKNLYAMYGITDEATLTQLRKETVDGYVVRQIMLGKAAELGLDQYTAEELAANSVLAAEIYEEQIAMYIDAYWEEDMTEEQAREALISEMEESGFTLEYIEETLLDEGVFEKLYDYIVNEIALTEEALNAYYDQRVTDDTALYESDILSFEYAMMDGETSTYVPEGFRTVKHILLQKDEERYALLEDELADINIAIEAGEASELQKERKPKVEEEMQQLDLEFQALIDEVAARIAAGDDFGALIAEYGADPGMTMEPGLTDGYYVHADSYVWDPAFTEAAMALQSVGDVSPPIAGDYGIHFIRYESEVPGGVQPLDTMREKMESAALEAIREEAYHATEAQWLAEANVEYFYENMR